MVMLVPITALLALVVTVPAPLGLVAFEIEYVTFAKFAVTLTLLAGIVKALLEMDSDGLVVYPVK